MLRGDHKSNEVRPRLAAAVATLVAVVLILLALTSFYLTYPPQEPSPYEHESPDILLADEYIPLRNIETPHDIGQDEPVKGDPVTGPEAAPGSASGQELKDEGSQGSPSVLQTQQRPSIVKQKVTPAPKEPATPKENPKKDAKKAQAANINTSVSGAFSKSQADSRGNNVRAGANPDGGNTSDANATGVSPGARIGNGWSIATYGPVGGVGKPLGSVVVAVEVDAQGLVISAVPAGGVPPAAANAAVVRECVRAAMASRFKRKLNDQAPARTPGRITWTFK